METRNILEIPVAVALAHTQTHIKGTQILNSVLYNYPTLRVHKKNLQQYLAFSFLLATGRPTIPCEHVPLVSASGGISNEI